MTHFMCLIGKTSEVVGIFCLLLFLVGSIIACRCGRGMENQPKPTKEKSTPIIYIRSHCLSLTFAFLCILQTSSTTTNQPKRRKKAERTRRVGLRKVFSDRIERNSTTGDKIA